jgi:hypothetical protein
VEDERSLFYREDDDTTGGMFYKTQVCIGCGQQPTSTLYFPRHEKRVPGFHDILIMHGTNEGDPDWLIIDLYCSEECIREAGENLLKRDI